MMSEHATYVSKMTNKCDADTEYKIEATPL